MTTLEELNKESNEEAEIAFVTFKEYLRVKEDELIKQMECEYEMSKEEKTILNCERMKNA